MPYYEYRCTKCGKTFEKFNAIKDADRSQVCPSCGSEAIRHFVVPEVIFHGSGYYVTDHRSESSAKGEGK